MTNWNMDVRTARHLVALAKHLSFTQASRELGITQSALSRSIQRFEEAIDLRLFDRTRGGVSLTATGTALAARAMALVKEANDFERTIQQCARGVQDSISFGIGHLPAKTLLAQVMTTELREDSSMHVRAFVRTSEVLFSMLLLDEIEFLICAAALMPVDARLKQWPIGTYTMDHLVRPGHPLLDSRQDRKPDEFPWIITKHVTANQPGSIQSLSHLRDKPQLEIEDIDCLALVAQNSDAIWVTSRATAVHELQTGALYHLPTKSSVARPVLINMYSRSDRSLSPTALRLRDRFRLAAKM